MRQLRLLLIFGLALSACSDGIQTEAADLHRPSGLALVDRPVPAADQARADLYVADSESQGVRIRQSWQYPSGDSTITRSSFVKAPIVFFPLRILTRGFPSRLSVSANDAADRLFVVAATGEVDAQLGLLYVLDITEMGYGAAIEDQTTNKRLGSIALEAYLSSDYYPVDVVTLGYREDTAQDVIAVLMNSVSGQNAQLLALVLNRSPSGFSVDSSDSIEVLPGAQRVIKLMDGRLVVSSSLSDSISQLSYTSSTSLSLHSPSTVDAGGPTRDVINAGSLGVFALRQDSSALSVFSVDATGSLTRSSLIFDSPYLSDAQRLNPTPGEITLRSDPVMTGAAGQLSSMVAESSDEVLTPLFSYAENEADRTPVDVVGLFHVNGETSFIVPDDSGAPQLALSSTSAVSWLRKLPGPLEVSVAECDTSGAVPECSELGAALGSCAESVVTETFDDSRDYRAEYRGNLYWEVGANLVYESASGDTANVELRSDSVDFTARGLQAGDNALVQLYLSGCGEGVEYKQEGTVSAVSEGAVDLSLPNVSSALLSCMQSAGYVEANRVEVYPSGEEAVLTQRSGEAIVSVLQRVAVGGSGSSRAVRFDGLDLAGEALPVAFTLQGDLRCLSSAESDPDGDDFVGRDSSVAGGAVFSRICSVQTDCGNVRGCFPASNDSDGCFLMCEPECTQESCVDEEIVRFCAGVQLRVAATEVAGPTITIPYAYSSLGSLQYTDAGTPADAVFSTMDGGWVISYPANRSLVTLKSTDSGFDTAVTR